MNLQESIKRILREETKSSKYIPMLVELTEDFKNEDCVCDIQIKYKNGEVLWLKTTSKSEEYGGIYVITVVLDNKELDDKFNGIAWSIRVYKDLLKMKITNEVSEFLPIPFYVEFRQTPKCYKNLQESENKKEKSLESLEKSVNNLVNMYLEDYDLPSNFKRVAVNVTYDNYGRIECRLTMLVDGYFNWQISEKLQNILKKIKKEIGEYFGNAFNRIEVEVSTVEVYEKIRRWYDQNKTKNLNESENKKSGLLRAIDEDGLYQVMQDTGLSMGQIILKYDNLPREVFERFIKDFINEEGYHHPNGFYKLGYEVEISRNKYVDTFYLYGDSVTVEIKELDLGMMDINSGGMEYLENLTDEEIFNIVDDITSWYSQNNL